jgi:cell division protein FtsQ
MYRRGGIVTVTTEERPAEERPARPAIDPRIRERRIEVIREAGRRRLRVTLILASAIVVLGLGYLTVHSPLLDVDHIRITGAQRERTSDLVAASGVHIGAPMLWVDSGRIAHRLEQLPWVAHARVVRDFPGTIDIKVTEYVPTVFVRVAPDRVALVASTGRVIAFAASPPAGAIEVTGEPTAPEVGSLLSPPGIARASLALPGRLRAEVTAITVRPSLTLTLRNGGPQIRLGSLAEMQSKGVSALAVLDQLGGRSCQYIDVAAPQSPVSRCNP